MAGFKQILLKEVAPALKALGYEYDDALRDRQLSFAFKRVGADGIHRTITYLRRQHEEKPVGFGFTIELYHTPGSRRIHGYELGHLLWHAYGLRIDAEQTDWGSVADVQGLRRALGDSLRKLRQYGIPWLEDVNLRTPMDEAFDRAGAAGAAMLDVISPALAALGYEERAIPGVTHYFVKELPGPRYAIVRFEIAPASREPASPELAFRVELQVGDSPDPPHHTWIWTSLGELSWTEGGRCPTQVSAEQWLQYTRVDARGNHVKTARPPAQAFMWRFADHEELQRQLEDALCRLREYGLAWLETENGVAGERPHDG